MERESAACFNCGNEFETTPSRKYNIRQGKIKYQTCSIRCSMELSLLDEPPHYLEYVEPELRPLLRWRRKCSECLMSEMSDGSLAHEMRCPKRRMAQMTVAEARVHTRRVRTGQQAKEREWLNATRPI
jgi:hypothetical protein